MLAPFLIGLVAGVAIESLTGRPAWGVLTIAAVLLLAWWRDPAAFRR